MPRKGENIFKRKDGRWEARYIHHRENGKAKYCYVYGATYNEVKVKKKAALQALNRGTKFEGYGQESEFGGLAKAWLSDIRINVKESTYTRYYRIVNKYLLPMIDKQRLDKMDQGYLNGLTANLLLRGGTGGTALAPKTVTDILCVLKSILKYGTENGVVCPDGNRLRYPPKKGKAAKILTDDNRIRIERQLLNSDDTVSLGILFTLFTGVRIGELCGLRWGDVDFPNATVSISRTVERIDNLEPGAKGKTKVVLSEPKTECSVRVIPLPGFLLEYMERQRCGADCYLLTGKRKHTEPHQYYVRYQKYLARNKIDRHTFHTLRHTFATRCVEMGFDTKSLSEILGHSSITTTLSVYVHPSMQQKKAQMEKLTPHIFC
ncbi:MAG: site-specific integrase [Lachnospiraceae bacterium]|nr:site-specific integrase [Lachnospiraceae bacterium]